MDHVGVGDVATLYGEDLRLGGNPEQATALTVQQAQKEGRAVYMREAAPVDAAVATQERHAV